jgi:hypothetical protein
MLAVSFVFFIPKRDRVIAVNGKRAGKGLVSFAADRQELNEVYQNGHTHSDASGVCQFSLLDQVYYVLSHFLSGSKK